MAPRPPKKQPRCPDCGAPLAGRDLTCAPCSARASQEQADAIVHASQEAQRLTDKLQPKIARQQRLLDKAIAAGDGAEALRRQESVLRLTFAPTLQMLEAMPDPAQAAESRAQIEAVIRRALESLARCLDEQR